MTERTRLDELNSDQYDALCERLEAAEAAIAHVQALHVGNANAGACEHCSERDYPNYAVPFPCPTIRALDNPKEN